MIAIETLINSNIENTWDAYMNPERMIHWNFAGEDWHSPQATNDLSIGGSAMCEWKPKMEVLVLILLDSTMKLSLIKKYNTI